MINNLYLCVTFFYDQNRLRYLKESLAHISDFSRSCQVYVLTNTSDPAQQAQIARVIDPRIHFKILTPRLMGHPYLLTWCHFDVFKSIINFCEQDSHFIYIEDDIKLAPDNIDYWFQSCEQLKPIGLLPSFVRYECNQQGDVVSTDQLETIKLSRQQSITFTDGYAYTNLKNPYQGMYMMDFEMMKAFFHSPAYNPDFTELKIRETACLGLTYVQVPSGFECRTVIRFDLTNLQIDPRSLIHHQPNNYALDPTSPFGKIKMAELISHA